MPSKNVEEGSITRTKEPLSPDIDGGWAWVIAGAALLSSAIASGIYYTFSIFYVLLLEEFQSSRALTAWVGSLNNGVYMLAGPIATYCIKRIGTRCTVMIGGVIVLIGFASSSLAPNLTTLFFTYGLVAAFGCCLNYTGFIVAVSTYFHEKYAIAFSITQTGVGIGIFVFGPLFKFLIEVYGWRGSFLICGAFGFNFTLLGALIFPLRKAKIEAVQVNLLDEKSTIVPEAIPVSIILRDARGWLLHLNSFFWLLATLIMYILLGDFAASKSLDDYYIYMFSAMGVGDLFGRLLTGPFIEYFRLDVIKMYSVVQSLCSLSIFTFLLVSDGIHLIVQGVIFSFLYGCQCVLLALVPRHIFGAENLSVIFGVNMFFGGAGILIGPPIAGLLVDITHSYTAAFVFSGLSELAGAIVCLVCLYLTRKTSVNLQNVT